MHDQKFSLGHPNHEYKTLFLIIFSSFNFKDMGSSKYIPFGIVEKATSRDVAISSTVIAADSEDSTSDYEVLDID